MKFFSKTTNAKFEVIRGTVSDLVVERGEQEFVQTGADKAAGAGAATGLALAGMAGAATGALLASSGSADPVEFFTAMLDDKRIAGRFSRVGFKDGDEVEAVVEQMNDGSYSAYAVRRPSDSTIWMFPHCSRGRVAHWKHALFMILVISLAIGLLLNTVSLLMAYFSEKPTSPRALWIVFWLMTANAVVVGTYFPIKIAWKWRPFVRIAEKIFEALGYADPKRVDLEKDHKLASKARGEKWPYLSSWVYRSPQRIDSPRVNT